MLALARSGRIGQRAPVLLPPLVEALKDRSADVRRMAVSALMSMNAEALSACGALTSCLIDTDISVRLEAARALYFIRFETEAPIAVSLDILQHSEVAADRRKAASTLRAMGSDAESAVPALQAMQNDQRRDMARDVTQALESIQRRSR
jgi:HEAT repeat protein